MNVENPSLRLARLAGGLLNWLNRAMFRSSSAVATICESLIADANRRGVTVVMVTHDREIAARADRVVTLHGGRVEV